MMFPALFPALLLAANLLLCSESGPLGMPQVGTSPIRHETILDFGSIRPSDIAERSVKVQGAQVDMYILSCLPALREGLIFISWVDKLNTVKFRMANVSVELREIGRLRVKITLLRIRPSDRRE